MPENVNTSPLGNVVEQDTEQDDRPVMVNVDHVSMVFNMANEQLNSLKEYAIALARRELMFKEFRALDDVSFTVRKGDVFGILGTNGSGKSTMLKIIAGVLEPSEGTCAINGNIAPLIELGAGFDMELTARENVYLNGALLGYSRKFIDQHFDEIVEFAEVEKFLDMPMKNYSSGMVARIAFAIATVIVPEILIVDEVLSVGDFMFQQKCERRITKLIKEHDVTVLIVSHNNAQIERMCNRAIWIEKGHTRMIGDAKEVCRTYSILGGHQGSSKSEQRVFKLLENPKVPDPASYTAIAGDDRYGTAAKLMEGRPLGAGGTVVLAQGDSVPAAAAATGVASLCSAPLLLFKPASVPDITARALRELAPARMVVVGGAGMDVVRIQESLRATCPDAQLELLTGENPVQMGLRVFERAPRVTGEAWGDLAFVAGTDEMGHLVSALPVLYGLRAPILFIDEGRESAVTAASTIEGSDIKRVLYPNDLDRKPEGYDVIMGMRADVEEFADSGPYNNNEWLNDWVMRNHAMPVPEGGYNLMVASVWDPFDALTCGVWAAGSGNLMLLEDTQDLDSVSHAIYYIQRYGAYVTGLTFFGDLDHYGKLDKSLLAKAIRLEGEDVPAWDEVPPVI